MKTFKFNLCKYTITITIEKKTYNASNPVVEQEQYTSTVNELVEEIKMEAPEYAYPFVWCCEQYIENQEGILAESTLKGYKNIIDKHLGVLMACDYEEITEDVIQDAFTMESAKGLSKKTLKGYRTFILKVLAIYRPDLHPEIRIEKETSNENT